MDRLAMVPQGTSPFAVAWEATSWRSIEHCSIESKSNGLFVTSHLEGEADEVTFDLQYKVTIDAAWRTVAVTVSIPEGTNLVGLRSDAHGTWMDSSGQTLGGLSGCIDIDLSLSPLTNTLPIRRLDFAAQPRQAITVVYIDVPAGHFKPMRQWYAKRDDNTFTYEDENGYSNTITVDESGFVVNYPGLFRRTAG